MVRAIVSLALFVCAVVLAGCCAFGVYYYLTHYQRPQPPLRVQAEELDWQRPPPRRPRSLPRRRTILPPQEELASQARDIDRLEQQVNTYQMQGAQNEQSCASCRRKNSAPVDENADYAEQIDALNAQLSKLNSRVSTPQDSNAALQQKSAFFDARTSPLWRTTARDYYHTIAAPTSKSRATGPTASTSPSRGANPPVPIGGG